jgi:formylglycine-generating enzyme required for sulfatase activity
MSLRPDTRYESVKEFAKALERPIGKPLPERHEPRRTPEPPLASAPRLPARIYKRMEQRTLMGAVALVLILVLAGIGLTWGNLNVEELPAAEATATVQTALVAALTAIAPTPTPIPPPTLAPTPTPEPFITQTGSRMIFMPEGIFRMGDDEGEADERPSNLIRLNAYYMDEAEVTNGQYAQCVEDGVCPLPDRDNAAFYLDGYYSNLDFKDYPVVNVSWYDAQTFCEWRGGRLPSEAEWEKAASFDPIQGIKFRFPWGDTFDGSALNDVSTDDGYRGPAPVGSYANGRSPIGLYDMAGNVLEWVNDWYGFRTYRDMTDTNPLGPVEGEFKVIRGGSWLSDEESDLTVIVRSSFEPLVARDHLGFRCAMTPP